MSNDILQTGQKLLILTSTVNYLVDIINMLWQVGQLILDIVFKKSFSLFMKRGDK
jgi:hypothetical protein